MAAGPNTRPRARLLALAGLLEPGRPMQVADVGARALAGGAPYDLLLRAGLAHLSGFEPDPEALAALRAAAPANATYHPHAVGRAGLGTFRLHEIGTMSSLYPIDPRAARLLGKPHWVSRGVREIPMTLVAIDGIEGFPALDALKMDAQGAELDILQGARRALGQAVAVIPEVRFHPIYLGEPTWAELDAELRAQGFALHKLLRPKSARLPSGQARRLSDAVGGSQLIDGDAVYIRSLLDPEGVPDDQLVMLALAAEGLFQSPDLVLHCLEHLARRGRVRRRAPELYADRLPAEWLHEKETQT